jgi:hypothetical protein
MSRALTSVLSHPRVDALLASDNAALLKRARSSVLHFDRDYVPKRVLNFLGDADSACWARDLNDAFGQIVLEWFAAQPSE